MIQDYIPVLMQIVIAIGFAASALLFSVILGRVGRRNRTKDSPYECGVATVAAPAPRFAVKFYLVAMLFILFDLEVVFMVPWAVVYREVVAENGMLILWSMLSFVSIITVGYIYAIKKGVLNWGREAA